MQPPSGKPTTRPRLTRERIIILVLVVLAVLISLSTIFGGLDNYQRLYEAGHKDPFGQTIDNQYGGPAGNAATPAQPTKAHP
jgi:hypothetical protein